MTDLETVYRVANVVVGAVAGFAVLAVVFVKRPDRAESWGMVGGALLCFAVALGSLGRLLGWNGELFLPFVTASLAYVAGGRIVQLWKLRKR